MKKIVNQSINQYRASQIQCQLIAIKKTKRKCREDKKMEEGKQSSEEVIFGWKLDCKSSQEGLSNGKQKGKCPSVRMSPLYSRKNKKAGVDETKKGRQRHLEVRLQSQVRTI